MSRGRTPSGISLLWIGLALGCSTEGLLEAEPESIGGARALVREPVPAAHALSPAARQARRLTSQPVHGRAQLNLVLVLEGLRPEAIDAARTPHLQRLRAQGVDFSNGHAVFPTVTRVNAPSLATGIYPERAGIVGDAVYVPELDPIASVTTGDWNVLREIDRVSGGRLLLVPSLAERLHAAGRTLAAISSGSSGSAYLLNHRAAEGVGVFVNGDLEAQGGRVAYPDAVDVAIRARFGASPPSAGEGSLALPVDWAEAVLRDYIVPELRPDVVLAWLAPPDGAQHAFGAGSPEGRRAIANDDRNIGLLLDRLAELGLYDLTNIFVVSDPGTGGDAAPIDVAESLVTAGLKRAPPADDVVVASNGQAVSIHVRDHDPVRIADIVAHLQARPWAGALFTRHDDRRGRAPDEGSVPGTFALDLIHLDSPERGADIVLTFDWSSGENASGVPGTAATGTRPRADHDGGHGGMSPWTLRTACFAWGVDFKTGVESRVPSSPVDIAPTLLALSGINPGELDGRVLAEALVGGPDHEQIPVETRTLITEANGTNYRAALRLTQVAHQRYVDESWRLRQ